jgi:AcrR family transcriptional regulator
MRIEFAFRAIRTFVRNSSGRRADKRRSMETAVLDGATALLRAGGPEALTMSELAAQLGVSVGGLYRYYPNKGSILVGLEKRAIASLRAVQIAVGAALEPRLHRRPAKVAALARVLAAAASFLEHRRRDPLQHRLLVQLLAAPDPLLDEGEVREVESHVEPVLAHGARLLAAAAAARALAPGDEMTRTFVLWAALQGADQFRKRDRLLPPHLHAAAIAYAATDALLAGWGASAADLKAARKLVPSET